MGEIDGFHMDGVDCSICLYKWKYKNWYQIIWYFLVKVVLANMCTCYNLENLQQSPIKVHETYFKWFGNNIWKLSGEKSR